MSTLSSRQSMPNGPAREKGQQTYYDAASAKQRRWQDLKVAMLDAEYQREAQEDEVNAHDESGAAMSHVRISCAVTPDPVCRVCSRGKRKSSCAGRLCPRHARTGRVTSCETCRPGKVDRSHVRSMRPLWCLRAASCHLACPIITIFFC